MAMISGGKLTYVEAKREKNGLVGTFNVNVKITDVKKEKDVVIINYTYTATYPPEMGHLRLDGEAYVTGDGFEKIYDEWKKDKKFNGQFAEVLFTYISFIAGANGTLVVRPLDLTPPIVPVRVSLQEVKEEKKS